MQFSTGVVTRCSGQNHITVPVTIGGNTRNLQILNSELRDDSPNDMESARDRIIDRLRSAIKEANANTFAQLKTALESKTFSV